MDVVTMNIIESTLLSICREMGITLMKTSYSTIFNESLDFTCAIADPDGEMISVAYFSSELGCEDVAPGPVGFVSHSGIFGGIMATECVRRGLGLGYLVSTGNEAGIDFADAAAYMARDHRIRVVAGYLEGVRDAGKLRAAAEIAGAENKPLMILKAGRNAGAPPPRPRIPAPWPARTIVTARRSGNGEFSKPKTATRCSTSSKPSRSRKSACPARASVC